MKKSKKSGIVVFWLFLSFYSLISCSKTKHEQTPPANGDQPNIDTAVAVYIGGDDSLFAFSASTGAKKWAINLKSNVYSSPAYYNGTVYVGCDDNKLYAFDTSGTLKWSQETDGYFGQNSPIVDNGKVYINCSSGSIYAFDAETGNMVWKNDSVDAARFNIVVKNNIVYTHYSSLYALDATTGKLMWSVYTEGGNSPIVLNGKVYVIANAILHVYDAISGKVLSSNSNGGLYASAIGYNISYGNIYTLRGGGSITCGDTSSSTLKWATPVVNLTSVPDCGALPVLDDSIAYFQTAVNIEAFNAFTGEYLFSAHSDGTTIGLTIVNQILYYTSRYSDETSGHLYAFDVKTQSRLWETSGNTDFRGSVACVVTKSGKMHRLGETYN